MQAESQKDYAPANAQERLLVEEVAACWRRLDQARRRGWRKEHLDGKTAQGLRSGAALNTRRRSGV
jgi:hypothetical protein